MDKTAPLTVKQAGCVVNGGRLVTESENEAVRMLLWQRIREHLPEVRSFHVCLPRSVCCERTFRQEFGGGRLIGPHPCFRVMRYVEGGCGPVHMDTPADQGRNTSLITGKPADSPSSPPRHKTNQQRMSSLLLLEHRQGWRRDSILHQSSARRAR